MEHISENEVREIVLLLLEDEDTDAFLFQRALRREAPALALRRVKDGLEALAYLQGNDDFCEREKFPFPHIIVLDLKMPRMSGLEFLSWVQDKPDLSPIPKIVLSGLSHAETVAEAYRLGANTFLVKPVRDWCHLAKMILNICAGQKCLHTAFIKQGWTG